MSLACPSTFGLGHRLQPQEITDLLQQPAYGLTKLLQVVFDRTTADRMPLSEERTEV